jgi:hypothetical protein
VLQPDKSAVLLGDVEQPPAASAAEIVPPCTIAFRVPIRCQFADLVANADS